MGFYFVLGDSRTLILLLGNIPMARNFNRVQAMASSDNKLLQEYKELVFYSDLTKKDKLTFTRLNIPDVTQ